MMKTQTSSRRRMLDAIKSSPTNVPPLPVIQREKLSTFDDPIARFTDSLSFVGGEAHLIGDVSEVSKILQGIPVFADAARIASLLPEAVEGNVEVSEIKDPHDLSDLDWTIAPGEFMVAENGAIWVTGSKLPHRVMIFIAQYLAIVVSRDQIVSNMHEAYERIGAIDSAFGIFVSGPSKTADIEQSLVLGAHGCRKLQVFIVD